MNNCCAKIELTRSATSSAVFIRSSCPMSVRYKWVFFMVKAEHNTVPKVSGSLSLACSEAALTTVPPPLTLFTWRLPLSPGRWERPPFVPQCFAIWRNEAKPPYMVLQPLYATYADPSRVFTKAFLTQCLLVLRTQTSPKCCIAVLLTNKHNHTHWLHSPSVVL